MMNSSTDLLGNGTKHASCAEDADPYAGVKLFNFGLTIFISIFGLVSNTLVVLVYRKTKVLSSTDVYLTALAISDNIQIISLNTYAYRYVFQLLLPAVEDWQPSGIITLSGILLESISQFINTYIIVLLGIDRCLLVKCLGLSKTWCKAPRARLLLAAVTVSAILFCVPRMFEYIPLIIHYRESIDKCKGYFMLTRGVGKSSDYQLVYGFIIYLLVMYIIPITLLSFTSTVLIMVICKRARWLRKVQSEVMQPNNALRLKKTEINAVITLVIVTFAFILFQMPDMALQFVWRLTPEHGPTTSIFTYELLIINSSVNFIIYAISSPAFRRRLKKVFRCFAHSQEEGTDDTMLGAPRGHSKVMQKSYTAKRPHSITRVST